MVLKYDRRFRNCAETPVTLQTNKQRFTLPSWCPTFDAIRYDLMVILQWNTALTISQGALAISQGVVCYQNENMCCMVRFGSLAQACRITSIIQKYASDVLIMFQYFEDQRIN